MPSAAMDVVTGQCEHLVLHFHGPVCDMSAGLGADTVSRLREWLAGHGGELPDPDSGAVSPYDILRFVVADYPRLAGQAEAELTAHEVRAAASARPARGLRNLLQTARVTIIGNICPAAVSAYLTRLYPREREQVRLVVARHGADPAILEPSPVPVLQAAQLLEVPSAACAVVASTPADIRSARLAGARAIGYARDHATLRLLTAAGAEAVTFSITELAGSARLARGRAGRK